MNGMLKKVALVAGLAALLTSGAVLSQVPLPLLQWASDVSTDRELLSVIDGTVVEYMGKPVAYVHPVVARTDMVVVMYADGTDSTRTTWVLAPRQSWNRFGRRSE